MGGGYSDIFSGTVGAIGDHQHYQLSFYDKLPVRTKGSTAGSGIGGSGIGDDILTITAEMVLAMCQRYHTKDIFSEQLVEWLEQICTTPKVRLTKPLRDMIKKALPLLKSTLKDIAFNDTLLKFESDIRSIC